MKGILADMNCQLHLEILMHLWQTPKWREIWDSLGLLVPTFDDLGLAHNCPDALLWQTCQDQRLIFLTANRNDDKPDSLESTIRERNTPTSLPVFTLANATRVRNDRDYAQRVAERLLEYMLDIEKYYGTGRLYVP